MERINAFDLLGATPNDSIETLQQLLDDKELLSDNIDAVQSAYRDLISPKNRLLNEIVYLNAKNFAAFEKLMLFSSEKPISSEKVAQILVRLGLWFDCNDDKLLSEINLYREKSGFIKINDKSTLILAINNLMANFIQSAKEFLSKLEEITLVEIFNNIVKIDNYESFFIDELIAYYELSISESLHRTEIQCLGKFEIFEATCHCFIRGAPLSADFSETISEFAQKLKNWDYYAQPLQVNMQHHGGQHEQSIELLHDLRNKIILIFKKCEARQKEKTDAGALPDFLKMLEGLISIIDVLQLAFAELEVDSEWLVKDKKNLASLKNKLSELNTRMQTDKLNEKTRLFREQQREATHKEYQRQKELLDEEKRAHAQRIKSDNLKQKTHKQCQDQQNTLNKNKCANKVEQSEESPIEKGRILLFICTILSLIPMIICIIFKYVGGCLSFMIISCVFAVCCAAYPILKGKGIIFWIITFGTFLALHIGSVIG